MVELLCTALLGMAFGHHTVQMYGPSTTSIPRDRSAQVDQQRGLSCALRVWWSASDMSEKRRLGQFYLVARCDACVSLPQFLQVRAPLMTSDLVLWCAAFSN